MLTDSQARNIIINCIDKNVFTNASAGAGKTTSLTKRIVSLIESGVDISKICTITYTKAAANEFYERLQKLLSDSDNENCKRALKDIDLCFMGTIDSFTNKIVNEHPIEMGIPAGTQVVDEEELDVYLSNLYVDIMNKEYDIKYPELVALRKKYISVVNKPKESFTIGLKTILDKRYAKLKYTSVSNIDESDVNEIKWYASIFLDIIDRNELFTGSTSLNNFKSALNFSNKVKKYFESSLYEASKLLSYISGIGLNYNKCVELNLDAALNSHLTIPEGKEKNYKYDRLNEILERLNKYRFSVCVEFLNIAFEIALREINKKGLLTYAGFLVTLRDTLKYDITNGHKIIDHIANKYKYFLLDESQDTSPLQTQIFFYINARNYTSDWKKCNPRPGSIFIVGDSKQSIYRFTGADVGAYLRTESLFKSIDNVEDIKNYDNIKVTLTKNFRSTRKLREWFNKDFENLLGDEINPVHEDIDLTDPQKENEKDATLNGAYRFLSDKKKDLNAKKVVEIVKAIVNNDKYTILPQIDKVVRKIDYKDIMIITRSKAFNCLMEELEKEKIPFYAEGRTLFENDEALNTIKILFKAIVCPSNLQYVYEALLSKYCNLNDNDIVDIVNNKNLNILKYEELPEINTKANLELFRLNKLYEDTKGLSYSSKFEYILNKIRIYDYVKIGNMDLSYYALEILRNSEKDGNLTTDEKAIEFIDEINSMNDNYERSLKLNNQRNALRLANVHKVKGLQAPVVILSLQGNNKYSPNYRLEFGDKEIFEPYDFCNIKIDSDTKEQEKEELIAEGKRLEYVAATRAESVLFIGYDLTKSGYSSSLWNDLLALDEIEEFKIEDNIIKEDIDIKEKDIDELYECKSCINESSKKKSYSIISPSKLEIKKASKESLDNEPYVQRNSDKYDAAKVGTIVHRMMELIANSINKLDINNIIQIINSEYGLDDKLKTLLNETYKVIVSGGFKQNGIYNDDILNDILNAKTVMCEVPFAYKENDKLYNGYMDLVYEDSNSNWHIIDYKTTYEMDVDVLGNKYKEQLESYRKALFNIMNIEAEAHIYHIEV